MMYLNLTEAMLDIVKDVECLNDHRCKQLRALFTSWLIIYGYEADTHKADLMLGHLKSKLAFEVDDDDWENYMYELVV